MCALRHISRKNVKPSFSYDKSVLPMRNQLHYRAGSRQMHRRLSPSSAKRTWSHLLSAVHCTATRPSATNRALPCSITLPPDRPCAHQLPSLSESLHACPQGGPERSDTYKTALLGHERRVMSSQMHGTLDKVANQPALHCQPHMHPPPILSMAPHTRFHPC